MAHCCGQGAHCDLSPKPVAGERGRRLPSGEHLAPDALEQMRTRDLSHAGQTTRLALSPAYAAVW